MTCSAIAIATTAVLSSTAYACDDRLELAIERKNIRILIAIDFEIHDHPRPCVAQVAVGPMLSL